MALRAVPDHPKTAHLKSLLKCGRGQAVGYIELLWHFTAKFTPRGDVGKYSDETIEAWIEWEGEPGALIDALVTTHWIDEAKAPRYNPEFRLVVHDWSEHADDLVNTEVARTCRTFCDGTVPKSGRLNEVERARFLDFIEQEGLSMRPAGRPSKMQPKPRPNPADTQTLSSQNPADTQPEPSRKAAKRSRKAAEKTKPAPKPEPEPEPLVSTEAKRNLEAVHSSSSKTPPPQKYPHMLRIGLELFPRRVDELTVAAIAKATLRRKPTATDDEMAKAMFATFKPGYQRSPMLWVVTVPIYVENGHKKPRKAKIPDCKTCHDVKKIMRPGLPDYGPELMAALEAGNAYIDCPDCGGASAKPAS